MRANLKALSANKFVKFCILALAMGQSGYAQPLDRSLAVAIERCDNHERTLSVVKRQLNACRRDNGANGSFCNQMVSEERNAQLSLDRCNDALIARLDAINNANNASRRGGAPPQVANNPAPVPANDPQPVSGAVPVPRPSAAVAPMSRREVAATERDARRAASEAERVIRRSQDQSNQALDLLLGRSPAPRATNPMTRDRRREQEQERHAARVAARAQRAVDRALPRVPRPLVSPSANAVASVPLPAGSWNSGNDASGIRLNRDNGLPPASGPAVVPRSDGGVAERPITTSYRNDPNASVVVGVPRVNGAVRNVGSSEMNPFTQCLQKAQVVACYYGLNDECSNSIMGPLSAERRSSLSGLSDHFRSLQSHLPEDISPSSDPFTGRAHRDARNLVRSGSSLQGLLANNLNGPPAEPAERERQARLISDLIGDISTSAQRVSDNRSRLNRSEPWVNNAVGLFEQGSNAFGLPNERGHNRQAVIAAATSACRQSQLADNQAVVGRRSVASDASAQPRADAPVTPGSGSAPEGDSAAGAH